MIGNFNFNAVESDIFSLVCKSVKRPLLPVAKTKRVELSGKSGAYDFDDHEFELRPITMKIAYIGQNYNELRSRARQIAAWLHTPTWARLIINDEPDKYYLAKITSEIDLISLWESGTANVVFDCQPFAYSLDVSGYGFTTLSPTSYTFDNPGTRRIDFKSPQGSVSKITVSGSWSTLSLSMNGNIITYDEAGVGVLTLDNIEMEADLDGVNKFNTLNGDVDSFLKIIPGQNDLDVGGTGLDITVGIEFVPLWL